MGKPLTGLLVCECFFGQPAGFRPEHLGYRLATTNQANQF
jgi:hypothetical protein